jgi:hypothetical protein
VTGFLAAFLATSAAHAFNPQPEPPAWSLVGLARTQFAVLNAVLVQPPDPTQPPDPALPCAVVLSFVDAMGHVFHDAAGNEVKREVLLRDGVAASLQLRAADILGATQLRAPIRPVIAEQPPDPGHPTSCVGLVGTLEIVNALGATQVVVVGAYPPGPTQPPDPQ